MAEAQGIAFAPLLWEHFDLALRRRTYFEPAMQALLAAMRGEEFAHQARILAGYDIGEAGTIRLNA
jgi:molybdate-binding protein